MSSLNLISVSSFFILCHSFLIHAQQPYYVGKTTASSKNPDASNSTSILGYSCNGLKRSCQTYLIFRSQPPYTSVASIAALLSADPSQLSQINSVSETETFETNKQVIVPVNCSCSGPYYQANTSFVVRHGDTRFLIAHDTFQGLSTWQALKSQNSNLTKYIYSGTRLHIPLRCACPTKNQTDVGIKYLLSYLITWGDYVSTVSARFGVDTGRTLEANKLTEQYSTIYPFTTLLVPLQDPPSSSQTMVPPSPAPLTSGNSSKKSKKKTWFYILVGTLAGGAILLFISTIIFFACFHKGKNDAVTNFVSETFEANKKPVIKESPEFSEILSSITQSLKVYSFKELQEATDNFSPGSCIKGSVYRGTINGDLVAIKKMNGEVSKEIELLSKINDIFVIRLLGVCFIDGDWYLVFEYAVNGPLSDWIYNTDNAGKVLNWTQRMQIALDAAVGIDYLHCFTRPPLIHQDIRSGNVLLDSDFRAKIANLGMARIAGGEEGQFALTRHIVGTRGHMAPEYLENGLVSAKLDVYAFGVLMLEMITGKQVAALYTEPEVNMNLSDVLCARFSGENVEESLIQFMDSSMEGKYPSEIAMSLIRLIHRCVDRNPAGRPRMDEIVGFLARIYNDSLRWELPNDNLGNETIF
ncbi:lysM domain receptor-like kinase 4 [Tripterygium wilfordii]|uniref:lysM domain receptor-like kinase 4 n=1 Tax=Tripterygium wilfordii TaxID=458696 RepID=UPI0018F807B7|nr:lysM domain receptor-like kinase 4 [Tripterygium wilfordii]XP_038722279.1 lysM domain receptor-like kinase 4 [Tripterygium wilfordii]